MKVYLSPQTNDKKQTIKFNKDIIQITVDDVNYKYNFSNLSNGEMTSTKNNILSAKRINGELEVVIINFIGNDSTEDEKFPQWKEINGSDALDVNAETVAIEWITQEEIDAIANAPKLPTPEERITELENMIIMMMEVM